MGIIPVPRVAVIVVAAGSGTRLSAGAPKAFVGIDELSILRHALDGVAAAPTAQVVIVAPAGREGDARTEAEAAFGDRSDLVSVVVGGQTRQQSVAAGLAALWADVETVLVHDAARALTPPDVFERVIAEVDRSGAGVVPVRPVVDTLKRVTGAAVDEAVDRAPLAAAQTPQGFPRALLESAYATAAEEFTDDTALFAAAGHPVHTVAGDDLSFKITTPADLDRARHLLRPTAASASVIPLVGIGTDVHAFGGEGALRLAGLEWPGEPGLRGHSDGDAVAHAIVDAVLAAAGLGDIGTHFGVDRPEYAGAAGIVFLRRVRELVAEAGYAIGNVSVQVQANRPRFAPRRAEAEALLTQALGAPVSVAATTTDGLGFTGAGEGVSATAVALVYRIP
ncbi:2C-methyl-D-erythritol 2,4-cyclodiphosphatesynthase [Microbacterium sp. TS-1]|uniref:2-C-methyl-D-erythritol 4-phosphate cytidylyltransferase n=1 Tax=Microbacterium sp. TS-1 TaxID=1344956 RepID=UPI00038FA3A5|nr:2-C-methyl-D-erythritol 4-phosphate cytidylyltransferase [Microbacterium sp. TS-1]GAD35312.1 2C-methyl-D-erythritol 2,4-cyclodiphosphatesynthase [Microbacterium sp. TS-1]